MNHPRMIFILKYQSQEVTFLDADITNLYNKPTNTPQLVHSSLCHCTSCKNAILKSQNIKIKQICTTETELQW